VKQLDLKSVDVGCDYITLTSSGDELCELLLTYAAMLEEEHKSQGAIGKEWRALGYRGWQIGPIRYGVRKEAEAILMVSGNDAKSAAELFRKTKLKVTRVDFQVTIELNPPSPKFVYAWYKVFNDTKEVDPTTPYYKYISSPTGDTLYINRRTGSTQLRMYDKSLDLNCDVNGTFVRFEVEYKQQAAEFAYRRWCSEYIGDEWVLEVVGAEYQKRGVNVAFDSRTGGSAIEKGQQITTVDGTISWLKRCVSPVIMRLIDAGYSDEVYDVLRIKDLY